MKAVSKNKKSNFCQFWRIVDFHILYTKWLFFNFFLKLIITVKHYKLGSFNSGLLVEYWGITVKWLFCCFDFFPKSTKISKNNRKYYFRFFSAFCILSFFCRLFSGFCHVVSFMVFCFSAIYLFPVCTLGKI